MSTDQLPPPVSATPTDAAYDRDHLRRQMENLRRAAATRARLENDIVEERDREIAAAKAEATDGIAATTAKHRQEIEATGKEYDAVIRRIDSQAAAEQQKIDEQRKTRAAAIERAYEEQSTKVKEDSDFEQGSVKEVFKEKRNDPQKLQAKSEKDHAVWGSQLDEAAAKAKEFLTKCGVKPAPAAADGGACPEGDELLAQLKAAHENAIARTKELLALEGSKTIFGGLKKEAAQKATELWGAIERDVTLGKRLLGPAGEWLKVRCGLQAKQMEAKARQDLVDLESRAKKTVTELAAKRDAQLADLEEKYRTATATIRSKVDAGKKDAEQKYPARLAALENGLAEDIRRREAKRDARMAAATERYDTRTHEMTEQWATVRREAASAWDEANRIDAASFPSFETLAEGSASLPTHDPPGLRFGTLAMEMAKIPGGVSARAELNSFGPAAWTQPAAVPFPAESSVLVKTTADQKEVAGAFLQALTLRIASGAPAGQTRFTIIDPLGLGKHFAGFMHLADHDELLVTSRIWTEPQQIEQRLADITEQMELVIQKYLRNEYPSIGAYNADAEVPEPYRFVVVSNFPANFTETSARRLASIAASGARCGVYTIVSVDTKQAMPANFSLSDIEQHATTLVLKDGTFTWQDPEFSKWPLGVEQSPSDEVFTSVIQRVGKAAKAAKRVEVPFDRVAPPEEKWWTGSTASGIDVPLGPAGAKKMQHMKLGKGTSQHVLIAGKTGSGKSTMMHALITNLALTYSPNEVQFYLIDFKKGVEFKIYDHYELPHARVIAIESEREFGLSVLEQLDRELKRRGDLFRDLAVQDLAGFRATGNPDPMPRVLLIIDEFQELFIEDDKLAQDASLILDRLVRQGRAFGMHVLLGSQTLGGSYSLPRATMGQMAVRIALQCNEADSSLILSEDNSAARLLTRPGEAIYNDANGMVAGNNPFQVVWLDDSRREWYLGELRRLADRRADIPAVPRIVFDGNQAADPDGNALLRELLAEGTTGGRDLVAPVAWLGDAIAIKDPTTAIFRRQGGANLLIVGQREDLAVSLLAMAIVGLAAANDPFPGGKLGHDARFVLLEPAVADEKPDLLLSRLSESLPHDVVNVGRLGVTEAMADLAAEVKRRLDHQVLDGEAVFVVVRDLARFRELRKADGDFGFSFGGGDKKAGPADNFATILRDGPAVGIHTLVWCDSLTNLMRTFERGALKEFELRVLFQMSASDSSQLVDSPLASKLGPQRALFIHEETGTFEKFRPYAFPSHEWLAGMSARLRARPQGTRVDRSIPDRPPSGKEDPAAEAGKEEFNFGFGGGDGEFNFTKFLDDPPTGDAGGAGAPPESG
jgi:energy-coupling factor transporter ATP-binding protein EcfA2